MRCDDLHGLLAGLAAEDLSPAQEELLQLHLAHCARCQERYATLLQTRRQLGLLTAAPYQPQLTDRVMRAVRRAEGRRGLSAWLGRSLQGAAVLASLLLVALVFAQGGPNRPAGAIRQRAPVYLVEGEQLVAVDLTTKQRTAIPLAPAEGGIELLLHQEAGALVAWALHETVEGNAFGLDRIDLATGERVADTQPKQGKPFRAILSPDGALAFVLADYEERLFMKEVDLRTGLLVNAHAVNSAFSPAAQPLLSPDGRWLYLLDQGRLLQIDRREARVRLDHQGESFTAIAALGPDGEQLLCALPSGGLSLLNPRSGELLRQVDGPRYDQLVWRNGLIYGVRGQTIDLIDSSDLAVKRSVTIPRTGPIYLP